MDDFVEVQLWYVIGIGGVYYGTKMQAEVEARKAFPDEDESKRYARVFCKTFYMELWEREYWFKKNEGDE